MVPVVSFHYFYNGWTYYNGAKVLHDLRWTIAIIFPDIMERAKKTGKEVTVEHPEVYTFLEQIPLTSDEAVKLYGKYYLEWMKHSTYDDYWRKLSPQEYYDDVTAPNLNING